MTKPIVDEWPHKHVAILRCRTWGNWPINHRVGSPTLAFGTPGLDGASLALNIYLVSYERRPRPENSSPLPCESVKVPVVWRGVAEAGFWLGEVVLKTSEDVLKVEWKHEPPHQGEMDVQLHIGSRTEMPRSDLHKLAFDLSTCAIGHLNLALGEHLVPVAPLQLFKLTDAGIQSESTAKVFVTTRPTVDELGMQRSLDGFVRFWRTSSPAEERAVSAAMRRYLSAAQEVDPLDKFCDLWEACEFATAGIRAPGTVVGRIAQALAAHVTSQARPSDKTRIERLLGIKGLHETRGAIVHEAEEVPEHLQEQTRLLEGIAAELLRYRTGLPYVGNPVLDAKLSPATPPA